MDEEKKGERAMCIQTGQYKAATTHNRMAYRKTLHAVPTTHTPFHPRCPPRAAQRPFPPLPCPRFGPVVTRLTAPPVASANSMIT